MSIDLARIRAETPGVANLIHLNNCGAALMPRPVLDALNAHLILEAEIGGYEAEDAAAEALSHTYNAVARLLNCGRDEIAIVENATVGWCMAFYGMAFEAGDKVLTAISEYASNAIAYIQMAKRCGIEIVVVPNDQSGQLDVAALENLIDDKVKLISITHVPTNGGLVNPIAEIGRIANAAQIPYLVDACQSAGQLPLDVDAIGCDMLSATGRKYLRGPRGTGFLYVRRAMLERLEPPFLDLHAAKWTSADSYTMRPDARRFENWENYVAGQVGLGVAVDYANRIGMDAIAARVSNLATRIRDGLSAIPGAQVHDLGAQKCGIVSFTLPGKTPDEVEQATSAQRINLSTSSVASTRFDMAGRGLDMVNRLGVHYYNSEAEIARFLELAETLSA